MYIDWITDPVLTPIINTGVRDWMHPAAVFRILRTHMWNNLPCTRVTTVYKSQPAMPLLSDLDNSVTIALHSVH